MSVCGVAPLVPEKKNTSFLKIHFYQTMLVVSSFLPCEESGVLWKKQEQIQFSKDISALWNQVAIR